MCMAVHILSDVFSSTRLLKTCLKKQTQYRNSCECCLDSMPLPCMKPEISTMFAYVQEIRTHFSMNSEHVFKNASSAVTS
jgi:hypothetical protein